MKQVILIVCLAMVLGIVLFSGLCYAAPIQWAVADGGNGHSYDVAFQTTGWETAKQLAETYWYDEYQGHLATITSVEEQQWLWSTLPCNKVWLGGYQADNATEPDEGWTWVTGEKWDYANWRAEEPNDAFGDEDYLVIDQLSIPGQWNDQREDGWGKFPGFLVEYETPRTRYPHTSDIGRSGTGSAAETQGLQVTSTLKG